MGRTRAAALAVLLLAAPRPARAITAELWVPDGVPRLRAVMAFTSVGIGPDWGRSPDFQDLARRLGAAIVEITDEDAFGAYLTRCADGGFKPLLDKLAELGTTSNHPELANVPIIGCGHSHGGDYWNYFNACYPERMALVFDKSSGGVQYTGAALATPMIWEVGSADARNSKGNFRAEMFAYRSKGTPLTLVLGPGEDHTTLGPAPRQLVIDLIEAIATLRLPADADPTRGPVQLRPIDESKSAFWLGDNYTRDTAPYATSAARSTLPRTSFLPTPVLAARWKEVVAPLPPDIQVADGTCPTCYPHPPGEPPAPSAPPPVVMSASRGGCCAAGAGAGSASAVAVLLIPLGFIVRRRSAFRGA
jgi:hypothetical protein